MSYAVPTQSKAVPEIYSAAARHFHWFTVALLAAQIPLGLIMSYRGNDLNIWDNLTNNLYGAHKLIGLLILLVVVARLGYRLTHGVPADEPTLEPWQKIVSHVTHWAIYAMLLIACILGWLGISYYPALDAFGIKLPALFVSPNEGKAAAVLLAHKLAAFTLILLAGMHVGAALFHYVIRKDGVLNRMLPGLPRRDGK